MRTPGNRRSNRSRLTSRSAPPAPSARSPSDHRCGESRPIPPASPSCESSGPMARTRARVTPGFLQSSRARPSPPSGKQRRPSHSAVARIPRCPDKMVSVPPRQRHSREQDRPASRLSRRRPDPPSARVDPDRRRRAIDVRSLESEMFYGVPRLGQFQNGVYANVQMQIDIFLCH